MHGLPLLRYHLCLASLLMGTKRLDVAPLEHLVHVNHKPGLGAGARNPRIAFAPPSPRRSARCEMGRCEVQKDEEMLRMMLLGSRAVRRHMIKLLLVGIPLMGFIS